MEDIVSTQTAPALLATYRVSFPHIHKSGLVAVRYLADVGGVTDFLLNRFWFVISLKGLTIVSAVFL